MWVWTGMTGVEFALLTWRRTTNRATDDLELSEGSFLGFHRLGMMAQSAQSREESCAILHSGLKPCAAATTKDGHSQLHEA